MTALRFGVISTAKIGREKVIPGIQGADGCEVTAIASRSLDSAQATADSLGIAKAYGSYEELLADADIDAVYIPLPNHLHAEWSIAAMRAGKHVLCEKPLAMDTAEVEQIIAVADETGVMVMEAFMYRLHPAWRTLVDLVASDRIGELVSVQSWFSYFNDDADNIRNVAEYGGGALMDIGCYNVNATRMLFGSEPDAVAATMRRDPNGGTDTLTSAVLGFGDRSATFTCSTRAANDQRVHVVGTTGRIQIDVPFNLPPNGPVHLMVWDGGAAPGSAPTEVLEVGAKDPYSAQAEAFAGAVQTGGPPPVSHADSLGNMRTIDRIVAAAD